jgi:hypothetical protein
MYKNAILQSKKYIFPRYRKGLVGRIESEISKETGFYGEIWALERLVTCLIKAGRGEEAANFAIDYYKKYRADLNRGRQNKIVKKISKYIKNFSLEEFKQSPKYLLTF